MNNPNPLKLETVIPLAVWLKDKPWNRFWVRWFLVYGLLPLALAMFVNEQSANLGFTAWFFGLYFAVLWSIVLYISMAPGRIKMSTQFKIAVFTVFVGTFLDVIIQVFPPFNVLYGATRVEGALSIVPKALGFILGVGILEESVKALPVYLFLSRSKESHAPLMFSFSGAISGLAFGVAEAVTYSYRYANNLMNGHIDVSGYIIIQFLRFITLPLLHACWSAIVGYFLGLAFLHKRLSRSLMLTGLLISALLHGLYDTVADNWLGVLVATLSLIIFISYVRTSNLIARDIQLHLDDSNARFASADPPGANSL